MDSLLTQKINKLYEENEYMKDFNGYILIRQGVDILYEQSLGMANFTKLMSHNRETVFCLGSMTKQFTAMCVLMLDQWGLLSIDDCIGKYLSDFTIGYNIRIRDILNMVSGIPEYWCQPRWKEPDAITQKDIYNFIKTLENYDPVGEKFKYCNSNYIALGVLIEKVSGMSYGEFVQKFIFNPLKMNRSGYLPYSSVLDNVAIGYRSLRLGPPEERKLHFSAFGAGNIYSSAADLCKWDDALYIDNLISNDRLKQMFTPVLGNYGMGWYINNNKISHGGDMSGFSTRITRYPESKMLILLLCNTEGCKESNIGNYFKLVENLLFDL